MCGCVLPFKAPESLIHVLRQRQHRYVLYVMAHNQYCYLSGNLFAVFAEILLFVKIYVLRKTSIGLIWGKFGIFVCMH